MKKVISSISSFISNCTFLVTFIAFDMILAIVAYHSVIGR